MSWQWSFYFGSRLGFGIQGLLGLERFRGFGTEYVEFLNLPALAAKETLGFQSLAGF